MSLDRQTQTGDSFSPLGRQRWRIIQPTNRDNGRLRKREVEHSNLDSLLVLDPMGKCYLYVTGALLLVTEFIINPFRLISMNQNDKKKILTLVSWDLGTLHSVAYTVFRRNSNFIGFMQIS